ncbi:MAG TPA: hypothetical protein VKT73_11600 [Xanthobacteraceae bacterium]|nr:hypothetical protein [Xanthobacteraceae bacterium]
MMLHTGDCGSSARATSPRHGTMAERQDDERPRGESASPAAVRGGVPETFSLQSVVESMKLPGADLGAEVLYRAFLAERDGRRFLVRVWLEAYRQIVEEDWPIVEEGKP